MLFKITDAPVRETNPEINSVEEFVGLTDRQLKWIFLVFDYESRYRKLPLENRKNKVALYLKFSLKKGTKQFSKTTQDMIELINPKIAAAVDAFKDLIYDEDKDTYEALRIMIGNIRTMISEPSSDALEMVRKTQLSEKLPSLLETKMELARILDIESEHDEEDAVESSTELSTLDRFNDGSLV